MIGFSPKSLAPKLLLIALLACLHAETAEAARLEKIKNDGAVTCGIRSGIAGFAMPTGRNTFAGMDVDVCRAVAAAIFGDPDRVRYVEAENVREFVQSDKIDIVSRRITWSLTRAASNDLMFGPVIFYDGQGFLVPRSSGVTQVEQLADMPVCVLSEERHVATLIDYFTLRKMKVTAVPVEDNIEAQQTLAAGRCHAYSADVSMLGGVKAALGHDDYTILPQMISKEPLAPLVRQGDDQFFEIVRWTIFAMIEAEERGINSQNVETAYQDGGIHIQEFLGGIPGIGAPLGLKETWAYDVIRTMGNYGEMFDRNVGRDSPILLERGLNRLWTDGGLIYAPPVR